MEKKRQLFFTEEFRLINVNRMTRTQNHHQADVTVPTAAGKMDVNGKHENESQCLPQDTDQLQRKNNNCTEDKLCSYHLSQVVKVRHFIFSYS